MYIMCISYQSPMAGIHGVLLSAVEHLLLSFCIGIFIAGALHSAFSALFLWYRCRSILDGS